MAESFIQAVVAPGAGRCRVRPDRIAIRLLCLSLGWLALLSPTPALGAGNPPESDRESSVLVATRDMAAGETAGSIPSVAEGDGLVPIPQTSDRTPELAGVSGRETAPGESDTPLTFTSQRRVPQTTAPAPIRRAPPVESASVPYEPVKFQGIMVGRSTKQELVTNWGAPDKSVDTPEGEVLAYRIHPFEAVEVLVGEGAVVSAIKIALTTSLAPDELAEQLALDQYRPAEVRNEQDEPLGQAYPERGVLFMFDASDSQALAGDGNTQLTVSHVVVQPLDARAFAMRAENGLHGPYSDNLGDLKTAIALEPDFAEAHYLTAEIYLATGQADLAEAAAARACELEPGDATYELCRGRAQVLLGQYDNAVLTVRGVLDRDDLSPLEKAHALYQMGQLASFGDAEIASKTIKFQTRSIELADKLATSKNAVERRAAKRLLVDAHMAMAEEIARQAYNEKIETLSLWIGRASGLAEEYINNDGGSVELRLVIAQRALNALASFRPTIDPQPWVSEAEEAGQALLGQSDDELWQARVKWELGVAYLNALRVEHVRRETTVALRYGQLAVDNLAEGALSRQAVHYSEQIVGQLYFQMGAVYAVHKLDHKKAAQWYDQADALLTGPRPVSELYAPRREGEMLVSMGVTYWQLGKQDQALKLTQDGVDLVEKAVADGILARTALAVPYGNLATMYKTTGETTNATKYADLARNVAVPVAEGPSRLGDAPTARQSSNDRHTNVR